MTASRRYGWYSLRFKLVLASVVIEALMLTVLVWNSARITGDAMQEIFQDRVETLVSLLNVSLADPLVQRDYATLGERLKIIVNRDSLAYVEVRDELGKLAASHGTVPSTTQLDTSFEVSDNVYDQAFDIRLAGRVIGRARYGLNVSIFQATLASLRNQGALVATAEIVLTILLLATLGALLTRHLVTLAGAARALQGGDYSTRVPVVGRDEVADTAQAFNAMADALARDIAERKQAERALKESEERFRATFEQAAVGIAQVAPDGRWLHVNQKLCDIVGYGREELLQRTFQDITYPDDLDADLTSVRRMLAGDIQTYGMEKRYIRKDGTLIWIYLTVGLVRQSTGEPKYFISVVEDISERKQAETALQQSEQRLRDLIDGLGPHMFVGLLTPDGILVEANRSALAAADLTPADVLGKRFDETYWWSYAEETKQQLRAAIERAVRGEPSRYDVTIRAGEDRVIDIDFSLQPLRDPEGRVVFLVPSANVITERKEAQRKVADYAGRLEKLSRRLLAAQEEERRHIARELHDELGQSLTAIKINLQARGRNTRQAPVELDAENLRIVEDALQQVRRLALALRPSMLDDLGLESALRWMANQQAEHSGFTVQFNIVPMETRLAPEIETACFRIVQETLTNIARHARAKHVTIELRREDDMLMMAVQDDGCGFDVSEARARAARGGSIGVLGIQERAALVGGQCEIESSPERGTTVRARFPWRTREETT